MLERPAVSPGPAPTPEPASIMARIPPGELRSEIHETPEVLEIVIPTRRNGLIIGLLGFWLLCWVLGGVSVISSLFYQSGDDSGLSVFIWLSAWIIAGALVLTVWLWNLHGCEIIRLNGHDLHYRKNFVLFCRSREFDLQHVKNLRVNPALNISLWLRSTIEFWGVGGGSILFDYGYSTWRFGVGLDEAEARHLITTITTRHPQLATP